MKETRFIEQNKDKWIELERMLSESKRDPDKASELFVQVSDDLSYARTYYGNRVVRVYLNQLTQKVFGTLLRNTVNHKNRFSYFWTDDLPAVIYHSRKELIFSFVLFVFCMLIGALSSHYDTNFAQTILGADYVSMTNSNISSGDPMAVYKDKDALNMFLYIAQNNLIVAFRTFLFGLLFAIGTIGSTVSNGIMVGVFQYYFISRGLLVDSALTIWMHGTMEISAIIIAGGAGLVMGKGLVFPGTFTRLQALRISARSGIKIMAGITPIILVAALIEGFITRYTELDNFIRLGFILLQAGFIVAYFVIFPFRKSRSGVPFRLDEQKIPQTPKFAPEMDQVKSSSIIFGDSFSLFIRILSKNWKYLLGISLLYTISLLLLLPEDKILNISYNTWFINKIPEILPFNFKYSFAELFIIGGALAATIFGNYWRSESLLLAPGETRSKTGFKFQLSKFGGSVLILSILVLPLIPDIGFFYLLFYLILPFMLLWLAGWQVSELSFGAATSLIFKNAFENLMRHYGTFLSLGLIAIFFFLLADLILPLMDTSVLTWNFKVGDFTYYWIKVGTIVFLQTTALFLVIPLFLSGMSFSFYSCREISEAPGLFERLRKAGLVNE
ncbi:MAG TPA: stage II sporulation protein M [Flavobacteriales bacterium]|nr:stage II sporulation protein M [Flavobacteriales bacterium]